MSFSISTPTPFDPDSPEGFTDAVLVGSPTPGADERVDGAVSAAVDAARTLARVLAGDEPHAVTVSVSGHLEGRGVGSYVTVRVEAVTPPYVEDVSEAVEAPPVDEEPSAEEE